MKRIVKHILLIQAAVLIISGAWARTSYTNYLSAHRAIEDTGSNLTSSNSKVSAIILRGSLVNFAAAYGKNFFDLNWNTIAEKSCDHFEIERSTDGENFEKVGEVKKDVTDEDNYYFRDNVKPAVARNNDLYYRLKQVDANGDFAYSKVLIARMYNTKTLAAMSITPDAVMNDVVVNVQLKMRSYIVIKLTDNAGNMVMKKSIQANDEFNSYKLDGTHELKPGMYSLEVIVNSNERMLMKLMKS